LHIIYINYIAHIHTKSHDSPAYVEVWSWALFAWIT